MATQNSQRASQRRYVAIDGLRFIAAIGVVMHHYATASGNAFFAELFTRNSMFVDFFFAISGFVIYHNYATRIVDAATWGDFLKNRLARVYPLHLVTFAIFVGLAFTIWRDKADRSMIDSASILPHFLMVQAWGTTHEDSFNYVSWSISAEWFVYLAFPAAIWLARRGGAAALVWTAALAVLALEAASWTGLLSPWTKLTWEYGALRAVPTFLFGAALAHCVESVGVSLKSFAPAWLSFGAAILAMFAGVDDRIILLLLMVCLVATVVAERDGATGLLTRRTMVRLGDLSYTIYMIHPLVSVLFISRIGGKILHLSGTPMLLWCAFCVFVPNLILAAIIHKWFEKPARNAIRDMKWPAAAASAPPVPGRAAG